MSNASKESRRRKAKLAAAKRHHPESDHAELKRDLVAANIEAYIEKHISEVPRFTDEQLDRIAVILRPAGGGHGLTRRPALLPSPSKFPGPASTDPVLTDPLDESDGGDAA